MKANKTYTSNPNVSKGTIIVVGFILDKKPFEWMGIFKGGSLEKIALHDTLSLKDLSFHKGLDKGNAQTYWRMPTDTEISTYKRNVTHKAYYNNISTFDALVSNLRKNADTLIASADMVIASANDMRNEGSLDAQGEVAFTKAVIIKEALNKILANI